MKQMLIDARMLGYSGIGRYLEELISRLPKEMVILLLDEAQSKNEEYKDYESVYTTIKPYSLSEQTKLPKIIDSSGAGAVHFPHINQPFRSLKIPRLTTVQDLTMLDYPVKQRPGLLSNLKQVFLKILLPKILTKSMLIVTSSQYVKNELTSLYGTNPETVHLIPLGVPSRQNERQEQVNGVEPSGYWLYVGNALPHKNLPLLFEAMEKMPEETLVCVGSSDTGYGELVNSAPQNVHFTGFVNDEQLAWLYANSRGLVFPSLSEGFGLPGLEAMLYNCPVVSSDATALPEVYGDAALYFDPRDVGTLIKQMKKLGSEPQLRQEMIRLGQKQVMKFSWGTTSEMTKMLYHKLLAD